MSNPLLTQHPGVRICMVRQNLRDLSQVELPAGFSLRTYRSGDERHWLAIEAEAEEHRGVWEQAAFLKQFGHDLAALEDRCFFVVAPDGRYVGTSTAWYEDNFYGRRWGRVHWVAIVPEFQGRGLSRPLMSATMNRLAESHDSAYLFTHTFRLAAVKLYLNYGFCPLLVEPAEASAWLGLRDYLHHPLLSEPFLTPADVQCQAF